MEKKSRPYRDMMTNRFGFMIFVLVLSFLIDLDKGNRLGLMVDTIGLIFGGWWFLFRRSQLDY